MQATSLTYLYLSCPKKIDDAEHELLETDFEYSICERFCIFFFLRKISLPRFLTKRDKTQHSLFHPEFAKISSIKTQPRAPAAAELCVKLVDMADKNIPSADQKMSTKFKNGG